MSQPPAQSSLRRYLGAAYAYAFLFDFILCYAIYTALFQLEGLNLVEIGTLIAFWSLAAVVLELPSGALSDYLDRRMLLALAPLFKALTFVCWALADGNFWLYALGFLFWSIGQALYSGTIEAALYERLDASGKSADYDKVFGRLSAAESLGIGAGLVLGGFVAAYDMVLSIWLSIPPLVLAALCAIALADTRRNGTPAPEDEAEPGYFENFRIAFAELRTLPDLRAVLLYISAGLILFEVLEEFDQLYYLAVNLPIWLFGIAGAAGLALHALASLFAHRLARQHYLAWLMPLVGGGLLVVASFGDSPWFVIVLELAYIALVPVTILAHARFQHLMEGRSRATTTSALEMAQNVIGIAVTFGFGLVAEWVGILPAYGWAGLCMLPVALWVWRTQRRGVSLLG